MLGISESPHTEGLRTETTLGTSVTASKKVLSSGGLLDSAEFWLRNDKALCQIDFLEDESEGSCARICFVNLDDVDLKNDGWTKMLASISPSLPKFILSLKMRHHQENEIVLLSGLESPNTCPLGSASHQGRRSADVCVVRRAGSRGPDAVACEVNRLLTGLELGQERLGRERLGRERLGRERLGRERQRRGNPGGRRAEDNAEFSVSSVDEDFLAASEHLGDHSEENSLQTDSGSGDIADTLQSDGDLVEPSVSQQPRHREPRDDLVPCGVTPDLLVPSLSQAVLSEDEPDRPSTEVPPQSRSRSFKLPKIIIMQSTDSDEGAGEQPASPPSKAGAPEARGDGAPRCSGTCPSPAPGQMPLACATTVTASCPWLRGPAAPLLRPREERQDFSLFSALCGVAQVAGAVALADLARTDEGASVEAFRTNIARVLLGEASAILCRREERRSMADFPSWACGDVADTVACAGRQEVDRFTRTVADSIWDHAALKAAVKREAKGPGEDVSVVQDSLLESVNAILLDVLCITSKKICDISLCSTGAFVARESEMHPRECGAARQPSREPLNQLLQLSEPRLPDTWGQNSLARCTDALSALSGRKEEERTQAEEEEEDEEVEMPGSRYLQQKGKDQLRASHVKGNPSPIRDRSDSWAQSCRKGTVDLKNAPEGEKKPHPDPKMCPLTRERAPSGTENKSSPPTPQLTPSSPVVRNAACEESGSPVSCFADDLACTVVSMATELAAIYLENSRGKQPWFCGLRGVAGGTPRHFLLPCRSMARRKDSQGAVAAVAVAAKHRPPRLSEIKRKAEEQPELMERLVNRVVDESVIQDEPPDAMLLTCPELSVLDTSAGSQPRSRPGCERLGRGTAASHESIPEEDIIGQGPAAWLGQDLSCCSSVSKQSSCESITDEFSKFMVNQMESEGRGFDLLLDYYAGKSAGSILSAAVQQVAGRRSGHLNVSSACMSKQSSTESITEEFYRFMLRDLDKEGGDYGMSKAKEWSNSLFPPSPRSPFCIRQSSMPDRRSSDSRLTVNSPVKANSFDGFSRSGHRYTLGVYPASSASTSGLCRSDSCLYRRGGMSQITDMLIHETWCGSIESLMRKNKIIGDAEDTVEPGDPQPHVELFADRLATDIVESGKSLLGGQRLTSVGERRRCFGTKTESGFARPSDGSGRGQGTTPTQGSRDVPQIHIQEDQRDGLQHPLEETPQALLRMASEGHGGSAKDSLENGDEKTSILPAGGSGSRRELLVVNFDLDGECVDWDLQATLQWIAASELGLPTLHFRQCPGTTDKFPDMVQLVTQRGWTVSNLFCAVVQYCRSQDERAHFLDWLLERLRP